MALAQEDIEEIQELIKRSIQATPEVGNANVRYELELRERTTRVEEELKHQRELMLTGFAQMEKRFEQVDKRFEQVDKRFEQVDKRFEQVDKRFEQMHIDLNIRFEQVDKKLEQMRKETDLRFETIDKQLELQSKAIMDIHQEIKLQMRWSFGMLLGIGGLVVGTLKLLG